MSTIIVDESLDGKIIDNKSILDFGIRLDLIAYGWDNMTKVLTDLEEN